MWATVRGLSGSRTSRARYLSAGGVLLLVSCRTPPPLVHSSPEPALARSEPAAPPTPAPAVPSPLPAPPSAPPPIAAPEKGADHADLVRRYDGRPALRVLRGEASYYGAAFAGRKTASGEVFDPSRFTAAHRTLPFGTVLRVTRLDTKKTVYVRVTDRGPFGKARRILDLSTAAAERLDMLRRGVAEIRADVVEQGKPPPPRKKRSRRTRAAR
jgi:rare lipoprotein A (peptidoglycan hydrolase)